MTVLMDTSQPSNQVAETNLRTRGDITMPASIAVPGCLGRHKENVTIMRKATTEQILESYKKTNSVWKTAKELGLCGQSIHERLVRINKNNHRNILTKEEKDLIESVYVSGILRGNRKLKELSLKINRTIPLIVRYAKSKGITMRSCSFTEEKKRENGERTKRYILEHGHPKGFLGRKHTIEAKRKQGLSGVKMWADKNHKVNSKEHRHMLSDRQSKLMIERAKKSPQSIYSNAFHAWREFPKGKKYFFRSKWEINYAYYL